MLTAPERLRADGTRRVVHSRELAALAPALVTDDDQPKLRGLPNVPRGTAVGARVIAGGRHLSE